MRDTYLKSVRFCKLIHCALHAVVNATYVAIQVIMPCQDTASLYFGPPQIVVLLHLLVDMVSVDVNEAKIIVLIC